MILSEIKTEKELFELGDIYRNRALDMTKIWQNPKEDEERILKASLIWYHYSQLCIKIALYISKRGIIYTNKQKEMIYNINFEEQELGTEMYCYFITEENIILGKAEFDRKNYDKLNKLQKLRFAISKRYRKRFELVKPIKCEITTKNY